MAFIIHRAELWQKTKSPSVFGIPGRRIHGSGVGCGWGASPGATLNTACHGS